MDDHGKAILINSILDRRASDRIVALTTAIELQRAGDHMGAAVERMNADNIAESITKDFGVSL